MVYKIRIRRQESQKSDSYWQEFEYDGSKNSSVATVLKELNSRTPLMESRYRFPLYLFQKGGDSLGI